MMRGLPDRLTELPCGSRTSRGTGDWASSTPQTAKLRTSWDVCPVSSPEKKVCTCSRTSTRTKAFAAMLVGGMTLLGRPGTDAEVGKLTLTSLPGVAFPLPYPFNAAYRQGAIVDPLAQVKSVPGAKPP